MESKTTVFTAACLCLALAGLGGGACCGRVGALLAAPGTRAKSELLELRGRILTPEGKPLFGRRFVSVSLHGSTSPFTATTLAVGGRFKFSKLVPGPYTIVATVRGLGEARQSVEVGGSLADKKGRVQVDVTLSPPNARSGAGHTVSVRQLALPPATAEKYNRALKELSRRNTQRAVELLEEAVEKTPSFVEALNLLGTIHYHNREFYKAEGYFRQALEHDANTYEPLVNLGGTLLSLNRFSEALPLNQNAALARPEDALAHSQLGMNYFALGDVSNALLHLNQAKKLDPAHFSHPQLTLAEIYLRQGDRPAAAAELEEFVRLHPDDPNAAKIRASLLRLRGN